MDAVDVVAVLGTCAPERHRYALQLARDTRRGFLPATLLAGSPDPVQECAVLASWMDPESGVVVELPDEVPATELIGMFAENAERTSVSGVVCVVDATHVLRDLQCDEAVPLRDESSGVASVLMPRAQLTVQQIEYASVIVLVNWVGLSTDRLSTLMAVLSHLSPRARLRLHRGAIEPASERQDYGAYQDRAGWICLLNGEYEPHMTDHRVSAVRFEQVRPFHPGRLKRVLDEHVEAEEFGSLVRSAGFCRLATRPHTVAQWDHVGRVISLYPLAADDGLAAEEDLLAVGQDLALIGLDLDVPALTAALHGAALTDDEWAAGPAAWARFADPFPAWPVIHEH